MAHADVRGWLPECQQEVGKSKNTQKEQEHTFSGHYGLRFQLYKLQDPCHALQPRKGARFDQEHVPELVKANAEPTQGSSRHSFRSKG